jgi:hypothetical protein
LVASFHCCNTLASSGSTSAADAEGAGAVALAADASALVTLAGCVFPAAGLDRLQPEPAPETSANKTNGNVRLS